MVKKAGYLLLTVEFKNIGRRWTARCIELGTSTFGRSLNEAKKRIEEAILLHLHTLEEVNELERFLEEHGIKFYAKRPAWKEVSISVPLDRGTFIKPYLQPVHC